MAKCICDIRPYSLAEKRKSSWLYAKAEEKDIDDDSLDEYRRIADGDYAELLFGVEHGGRYVMVAEGEGRAFYYPRFCPECGRRLTD